MFFTVSFEAMLLKCNFFCFCKKAKTLAIINFRRTKLNYIRPRGHTILDLTGHPILVLAIQTVLASKGTLNQSILIQTLMFCTLIMSICLCFTTIYRSNIKQKLKCQKYSDNVQIIKNLILKHSHFQKADVKHMHLTTYFFASSYSVITNK